MIQDNVHQPLPSVPSLSLSLSIVTSTCISSPNYPSDYDHSSDCQFTVNYAVALDVIAFDVEAPAGSSCYDYVQLRVVGETSDTQYCGDTGPVGVQVDPSQPIQWIADSSIRRSGWQICVFSPPTPPALPPALPPPPPPSLPPGAPAFTLESGALRYDLDLHQQPELPQQLR